MQCNVLTLHCNSNKTWKMLTDKWFRNFSLTQRFYKEDKYSFVGKGFTHKSLNFNVTRF